MPTGRHIIRTLLTIACLHYCQLRSISKSTYPLTALLKMCRQKKKRANMPPARWPLTAPHSWIFPHTVVHSIHGLEIHFKCTARFSGLTLYLLFKNSAMTFIYFVSIPCPGVYQTQATMCVIFDEFALLCSYSAFSCFASSCLSF